MGADVPDGEIEAILGALGLLRHVSKRGARPDSPAASLELPTALLAAGCHCAKSI